MSAYDPTRTLMFCSSAHWAPVKNPDAPAVKREAEEDWGRQRGVETIDYRASYSATARDCMINDQHYD